MSDSTNNNDNRDVDVRVARLLRTAAETERAPETVRATVQAMEAETHTSSLLDTNPGAPDTRAGHVADHRQRRRLRLIVMPAALVVLIAVVALVHSGTSHPPSLRQVASLAELSPVQSAPKRVETGSGSRLNAEVQGLHFPDWVSDGGWHAVGLRHDELNSRPVTTVFYRRAHQRLAYSIVARPTIVSTGTAARGDAYRSFRIGSRTVVVWTASGHTCMLSTTSLSPRQLWNLALTA